ncbi:Kelch-like protein 13 [Schistosoma japonicum]|nr:Kelch-like protein 13 [Schistosoma japonicum]
MYQSVSGTVLKLIQEGLFSNVTVIINDHEFKSNSLLLASSSDYFRALFSFQQKSVEEPRLEIKCDYVSHVGLSHVMLFINSIGQIHDSIPVEDYQDVYIASSFLQVHYLQKLMSLPYALADSIIIIINGKIMNLAHWFDDDPLFKKAILFLWHEFQSVDYFSSDFVNLTTKQITKIFQSDQINISQERVVLEALLIWLCHDVKQRIEFFENNFLHLVRLPLVTRSELLEIIDNPKYTVANDALQFLFLAHSFLNHPSFLNELEKFSLSDIRSIQYLPNSLIDPKQYRARVGTLYRVYGLGGESDSSNSTLESYGSQSNEFMVYNEDLSVVTPCTPPYAASRVHHAVAASLNWIYVVGGESEEGELLNHCSRFSLTDLVWYSMSELDSPRSHHTLICIENYLYIFGGYCLNWSTNYSPASDSILTYDISTNKWSNSHHKLPFGLVMFAGGLEEYGDEMRPSDCAFLYDPIEEDGENFKFLPKLPTPLISVALACDTVEDQVFLCGGRMSMYGSEINDISNKVFSFKFSTNCWTQVTVLDFPRYSAFSFVLYDKLYVIGGITVDEVIENTSSSLLASLINIDSDDSLANRQQTLTTDTVRNITSNLLEQFSFGDYIRPNILQAPFRPCHFTEGWQLRSSQSSSIMLASTSSDNFYTSSTQSRPKRLKLSLARYNNHLPVITRCYAVYCIAPYLNCIK